MAEQDFDELVDNFELFDDWEERYRYVIDLGKQMPDFPDALKTDATLVEGCVSRVWLDEKVSGEGSSAVIEFSGDSDAFIVDRPVRASQPPAQQWPECHGRADQGLCRGSDL